MLPEVRTAMDAAARQYVHLDELAEAVGARLAALTGAEWRTVRELAPTGSYRALQSSRMREHSRPDGRDGNKGTEKRAP